ncbi:integrase core domain-containing protein [Myxococcota bacterium]
MRLPPRTPNLNAHLARFVLSVKRECLDRMSPLGKRHLELIPADYLAHYREERIHQGLGDRLIGEPPANSHGTGAVRCRERPGELSFCYREAA